MLEHSREAVRIAGGRSREELARDRLLQLALTRLVEVIGEAASQVSSEGKDKWSHVPWQEAISTRNRLIHGYDVLDINILWDTVTVDLPPLIETLERILESGEGG